MRCTRLLLLVIGFALLPFIGGCATWINIPAQEGDLARHDPNIDTVVEVEAAALGAVLSEKPLGRKVNVILPAGTSPQSYRAVLVPLGDRANQQSVDGAPTARVTGVRVRGRTAEVDVNRPIGDGSTRQDATAYLEWEPIAGWQTTTVRYWRGSGDAATPDTDEDATDDTTPDAGNGASPEERPATSGDQDSADENQ